MPLETADDFAVFFDADEFGASAVYTEPGAAPLDIVVIRDQGEREVRSGIGRVMVDVNAVLIQRSDVERPVAGAALAIGSDSTGFERFTIQGGPALDRDGNIWTCNLEPAG